MRPLQSLLRSHIFSMDEPIGSFSPVQGVFLIFQVSNLVKSLLAWALKVLYRKRSDTPPDCG